KMRKQKSKSNQIELSKDSLKMIQTSKWWFGLTVVAFIVIAAYTGYDIYQSAMPYNGKVSWVIQHIRSEREVPFTRKNIYEDGLLGLIEDVNQKVELPDELYLSNEVDLSFTKEGQITKFYGFIYGKNTKGETDTFFLSYDEKKKKNIQIYLDNYLKADYNN